MDPVSDFEIGETDLEIFPMVERLELWRRETGAYDLRRCEGRGLIGKIDLMLALKFHVAVCLCNASSAIQTR